jgi:HlyD family secretion protein
LEFQSSKLIHYVKEINLPLNRRVVVIALLIILSKTGLLEIKMKARKKTAVVNAITIVETVSATGKIQPEIEVKISSEVSRNYFITCRGSSS